MPSKIPSQLFHADAGPGEPAVTWTTGDLRNLLVQIAREGAGTIEEIPDGIDQELVELTRSLIDIAATATASGHSFDVDLGEISAFTALVHEYLNVSAKVPYPGATPIMVRLLGQTPMLILTGGNETTGRLEYIFCAYPAVLHGRKETGALVPYALIACDWHDTEQAYSLQVNVRTDDNDLAALNTTTAIAVALLCMIADDRQPLVRVSAPAKVNKARVKRGKLSIPEAWKVRYVTQIDRSHVKGQRADKGGSHASPRPHDRRGHERHLASGKLVWVRPSRIGEIEKHLTRDRDYYRIAITSGAGR